MKADMRTVLATVVMAAAAVVFIPSCRQHDYRVASIHIPAMKNRTCAEYVRQAVVQINDLPSMKDSIVEGSIDFDMETRTMTVEYNSMQLALKNIERYIANAGFDANETKADPEAVKKLPDACK
jgi:mercuric ion binding protein